MNRLILPTLIAAALTLGLSACSSTGTPKAEVQPATPAKTGTAPSGAAATSGAGGQNVTGTQTPGYTDERLDRLSSAQAAGYLVVRRRTVQFPDGRTLRVYRPDDGGEPY